MRRRDRAKVSYITCDLTSTLMESLIKEMNYRVKGSEKFWNNPDGANHILAIKAAALSDDDRLTPTRS